MRYLSDAQFALAIILPILLFNLALIAYPLVQLFYLSLHDYNILKGTLNFVGISNYILALQDPDILQSMIRTLIFSFTVVTLSIALGLFFALLLNEDFKGRSIIRTAVLIPWGVSEFATSTIWRFILNDSFGSWNGFLYTIHVISKYRLWLGEQTALMWSAIAFTWHLAPLGAFFLLAALQAIPQELYNASKIDGAGSIRRFFNVTFPYIRYAILIVLVLATVEAFRAFDIFYILTGGGPGRATEVLTFHIYRQQFHFLNLGFASAISWFLTFIVIILATIYFILLTRKPKKR